MQQHPAQNWQPPAGYPPPQQQWAPQPPNWGPPPAPRRGPRKVSAVGSTGLALSVLGVFVFPLFLGLAGIICGIVDVSTARTQQRGAGTGWAAIIVGAIAMLVGIVLLAANLTG